MLLSNRICIALPAPFLFCITSILHCAPALPQDRLNNEDSCKATEAEVGPQALGQTDRRRVRMIRQNHRPVFLMPISSSSRPATTQTLCSVRSLGRRHQAVDQRRMQTPEPRRLARLAGVRRRTRSDRRQTVGTGRWRTSCAAYRLKPGRASQTTHRKEKTSAYQGSRKEANRGRLRVANDRLNVSTRGSLVVY